MKEEIHNRTPMILLRERAANWLNPGKNGIIAENGK